MQLLAAASKSRRTEPCPAEDCARAVLDGLPPVMWFIRCHMRKQRTRGLSVPQFRALCWIDRHPTASLSLLAEHLGSSQPNASRLVTGLVQRGYVSRKQCSDDRRQLKLLLTARGQSVLAEARDATQKRIADEIERVPESERQGIIDAMRLLTQLFDCNQKP